MAFQIKRQHERMAAYDSLPRSIREAYNACANRLDVIDIAQQLKMGWPEEKMLEAIRQLPRGPVARRGQSEADRYRQNKERTRPHSDEAQRQNPKTPVG